MSKLNLILISAGLLVASAGLTGCNSDKKSDSTTATAKGGTVWANLGGEANVRKVVKDFVGRAASDKNVNFFRKGIPGVQEWKPVNPTAAVANLEQKLVELISSGTGGPFKYTGKSMKDSHKGMKITTAEFNALAGHLDAALKAGGAKDADRQAVMNFAGSTAGDIIEVK
jgi:hemoglobin